MGNRWYHLHTTFLILQIQFFCVQNKTISELCTIKVGREYRCISQVACAKALPPSFRGTLTVCGPNDEGVCCPVINRYSHPSCGVRRNHNIYRPEVKSKDAFLSYPEHSSGVPESLAPNVLEEPPDENIEYKLTGNKTSNAKYKVSSSEGGQTGLSVTELEINAKSRQSTDINVLGDNTEVNRFASTEKNGCAYNYTTEYELKEFSNEVGIKKLTTGDDTSYEKVTNTSSKSEPVRNESNGHLAEEKVSNKMENSVYISDLKDDESDNVTVNYPFISSHLAKSDDEHETFSEKTGDFQFVVVTDTSIINEASLQTDITLHTADKVNLQITRNNLFAVDFGRNLAPFTMKNSNNVYKLPDPHEVIRNEEYYTPKPIATAFQKGASTISVESGLETRSVLNEKKILLPFESEQNVTAFNEFFKNLTNLIAPGITPMDSGYLYRNFVLPYVITNCSTTERNDSNQLFSDSMEDTEQKPKQVDVNKSFLKNDPPEKNIQNSERKKIIQDSKVTSSYSDFKLLIKDSVNIEKSVMTSESSNLHNANNWPELNGSSNRNMTIHKSNETLNEEQKLLKSYNTDIIPARNKPSETVFHSNFKAHERVSQDYSTEDKIFVSSISGDTINYIKGNTVFNDVQIIPKQEDYQAKAHHSTYGEKGTTSTMLVIQPKSADELSAEIIGYRGFPISEEYSFGDRISESSNSDHIGSYNEENKFFNEEKIIPKLEDCKERACHYTSYGERQTSSAMPVIRLKSADELRQEKFDSRGFPVSKDDFRKDEISESSNLGDVGNYNEENTFFNEEKIIPKLEDCKERECHYTSYEERQTSSAMPVIGLKSADELRIEKFDSRDFPVSKDDFRKDEISESSNLGDVGNYNEENTFFNEEKIIPKLEDCKERECHYTSYEERQTSSAMPVIGLKSADELRIETFDSRDFPVSKDDFRKDEISESSNLGDVGNYNEENTFFNEEKIIPKLEDCKERECHYTSYEERQTSSAMPVIGLKSADELRLEKFDSRGFPVSKDYFRASEYEEKQKSSIKPVIRSKSANEVNVETFRYTGFPISEDYSLGDGILESANLGNNTRYSEENTFFRKQKVMPKLEDYQKKVQYYTSTDGQKKSFPTTPTIRQKSTDESRLKTNKCSCFQISENYSVGDGISESSNLGDTTSYNEETFFNEKKMMPKLGEYKVKAQYYTSSDAEKQSFSTMHVIRPNSTNESSIETNRYSGSPTFEDYSLGDVISESANLGDDISDDTSYEEETALFNDEKIVPKLENYHEKAQYYTLRDAENHSSHTIAVIRANDEPNMERNGYSGFPLGVIISESSNSGDTASYNEENTFFKEKKMIPAIREHQDKAQRNTSTHGVKQSSPRMPVIGPIHEPSIERHVYSGFPITEDYSLVDEISESSNLGDTSSYIEENTFFNEGKMIPKKKDYQYKVHYYNLTNAKKHIVSIVPTIGGKTANESSIESFGYTNPLIARNYYPHKVPGKNIVSETIINRSDEYLNSEDITNFAKIHLASSEDKTIKRTEKNERKEQHTKKSRVTHFQSLQTLTVTPPNHLFGSSPYSLFTHLYQKPLEDSFNAENNSAESTVSVNSSYANDNHVTHFNPHYGKTIQELKKNSNEHKFTSVMGHDNQKLLKSVNASSDNGTALVSDFVASYKVFKDDVGKKTVKKFTGYKTEMQHFTAPEEQIILQTVKPANIEKTTDKGELSSHYDLKYFQTVSKRDSVKKEIPSGSNESLVTHNDSNHDRKYIYLNENKMIENSEKDQHEGRYHSRINDEGQTRLLKIINGETEPLAKTSTNSDFIFPYKESNSLINEENTNISPSFLTSNVSNYRSNLSPEKRIAPIKDQNYGRIPDFEMQKSIPLVIPGNKISYNNSINYNPALFQKHLNEHWNNGYLYATNSQRSKDYISGYQKPQRNISDLRNVYYSYYETKDSQTPNSHVQQYQLANMYGPVPGLRNNYNLFNRNSYRKHLNPFIRQYPLNHVHTPHRAIPSLEYRRNSDYRNKIRPVSNAYVRDYLLGNAYNPQNTVISPGFRKKLDINKHNKGLNSYARQYPLSNVYSPQGTVLSPRIRNNLDYKNIDIPTSNTYIQDYPYGNFYIPQRTDVSSKFRSNFNYSGKNSQGLNSYIQHYSLDNMYNPQRSDLSARYRDNLYYRNTNSQFSDSLIRHYPLGKKYNPQRIFFSPELRNNLDKHSQASDSYNRDYLLNNMYNLQRTVNSPESRNNLHYRDSQALDYYNRYYSLNNMYNPQKTVFSPESRKYLDYVDQDSQASDSYNRHYPLNNMYNLQRLARSPEFRDNYYAYYRNKYSKASNPYMWQYPSDHMHRKLYNPPQPRYNSVFYQPQNRVYRRSVLSPGDYRKFPEITEKSTETETIGEKPSNKSQTENMPHVTHNQKNTMEQKCAFSECNNATFPVSLDEMHTAELKRKETKKILQHFPVDSVVSELNRKQSSHRLKSRGKRYKFTSHTIGGKLEYESWPWVAAVYKVPSMTQICAGTLIDDRHILTAAHCFSQNYRMQTFIVSVGSLLQISDPKDGYVVEKVIIHEGFKKECYCNDIAVLRLARPVYRPYTPICIPDFDTVTPGDNTTLLGWGDTRYMDGTGKSGTTRLQRIDNLPIVPSSICRNIIRNLLGDNLRENFDEYFLCAGMKDGSKDACIGDSGGPLLHRDYNGMWTIVGIVSFGIKCGLPGVPGIYSRVSYYMPWILKAMDM